MNVADLRLLIVEDSPDDAELVASELRRGGLRPVVRRVDTRSEMERALREEEWDAVVADNTMPRFSAKGALDVLRESGLDLPFVIVSGSIGEAEAVAGMKAGAHDYVMKWNLARLAPALKREIVEAHTRAQRRRAEAVLREREQLVRTIYDNEPACVKVVSPDGLLLEVNASGLEMLGATSLDQVKGARVIDMVHPEDRRTFQELQDTVARGFSGHARFRMIRLDGGVRWMESHASPLTGAGGGFSGMLSVTHDITEQK